MGWMAMGEMDQTTWRSHVMGSRAIDDDTSGKSIEKGDRCTRAKESAKTSTEIRER